MVAAFSCEEQYTTYEGPEYIMFSEPEQYHLVEEGQEYFEVKVAATNVSDKERRFAVEVVDKGSNAIEGVHYQTPYTSPQAKPQVV